MINTEIWGAERRRLCGFLQDEAKRKGITHEQIAAHTGLQRSSVSRALAGRFPLSVDLLIAMGSAIGIFLFLESKDSLSDNAQFMRDRHKRPDDDN